MAKPILPMIDEVYRKLMMMMEGRWTPDPKTTPFASTFSVPVEDTVLRFRLVRGMAGFHRVESLDQPGVVIPYDPAWESREKLSQLITAALKPAEQPKE